MSERLQQIVRRRQALAARIAEQRSLLSVEVVSLRQSLGLVDSARRGLHYFKSRPLLVAIAAAGIAMVGPRKLLRVGYRSGLLLPVLMRIVRTLRQPR